MFSTIVGITLNENDFIFGILMKWKFSNYLSSLLKLNLTDFLDRWFIDKLTVHTYICIHYLILYIQLHQYMYIWIMDFYIANR